MKAALKLSMILKFMNSEIAIIKAHRTPAYTAFKSINPIKVVVDSKLLGKNTNFE